MNPLLYNLLANSAFVAFLGYLLKTYLTQKISFVVKYEYDEKLEQFKNDLKSELDKDLENYKRELNQVEIKKTEKWKLKRDACLEALSISEALLSHMEWPNLESTRIIKQDVDTLKFRECYNKLVCSCDDAKILEMFKTLGGFKGTQMRTDLILDFRNAIRKELGFGEELDQDRETTFFGWLANDFRIPQKDGDIPAVVGIPANNTRRSEMPDPKHPTPWH